MRVDGIQLGPQPGPPLLIPLEGRIGEAIWGDLGPLRRLSSRMAAIGLGDVFVPLLLKGYMKCFVRLTPKVVSEGFDIPSGIG
jgi:hypothetical protein